MSQKTYLYVIGAPGGGACVAKVGITQSPMSRLNQIFTGCPRRRRLVPDGLELFALFGFQSRQDAQDIERLILLSNQEAKADARTLGWLLVRPLYLLPQIRVLAALAEIDTEEFDYSYSRHAS